MEDRIIKFIAALRAEGVTRVLVLCLYPQYSAATSASVFDAVAQWAQQARWVPEFRFVQQYHDDAGYIVALAAQVRQIAQETTALGVERGLGGSGIHARTVAPCTGHGGAQWRVISSRKSSRSSVCSSPASATSNSSRTASAVWRKAR